MKNYKIVPNNDYLAHYGILGQKWGVRRFQNPDGSLTNEGKRRYGSKPSKTNTSSRYIKEERSGQNVKAKDIRKNMDKMSDQELQQAINRLNMQERVKDLSKDEGLQGIMRKGKEQAKEITATIAAFTALSVVLNKTFK